MDNLAHRKIDVHLHRKVPNTVTLSSLTSSHVIPTQLNYTSTEGADAFALPHDADGISVLERGMHTSLGRVCFDLCVTELDALSNGCF